MIFAAACASSFKRMTYSSPYTQVWEEAPSRTHLGHCQKYSSQNYENHNQPKMQCWRNKNLISGHGVEQTLPPR